MRTESLEPEDTRLRACHDWFGNPLREKIGGVPATVWEASTRLKTTIETKCNAFRLDGVWDDYVGAAAQGSRREVVAQPVVLPLTVDGTLKTAGIREAKGADENGTTLRARVWLAPAFALTPAHLSLLLEFMGRMGSKHARRVAAAISGWELGSEAFPIRVHLPLPLTLWAQVSCTDFRLLDAGSNKLPHDWFSVPQEYECRETSVKDYLQRGGGFF